MKRRQRYCPEALSLLEDRVVLSHAHVTRGLSVVVSGLTPAQQVLNARRQPVIAEVTQAFASFQSDFDGARATYSAALRDSPATAGVAMTAFKNFAMERTSLLSQQVIGSFLQSSAGTARAKGKDSTLKLLVVSKIIGPTGQTPPGSLAFSLIKSIPQPNTSPATASLFALSQDTAIQSAQAAVINGVNIVKNGDFGNQTAGHHK